MADTIKLPSECGHEVYFNDEKTKSFIKEELGIDLKETLQTDEDYLRAVFYVKCAGLQRDLKENPSADNEKCAFYLSSKENIDTLFDCMYQDMRTFEESALSPSFDDSKLQLYMTPLQIVGNDRLYEAWSDDRVKDNESVSRTLNKQDLEEYFKPLEVLHPEIYTALEEKRLSAKQEENAQLQEKTAEQKLMDMVVSAALKKAWDKAQKRAEKQNGKNILPSEQNHQTIPSATLLVKNYNN